VLLWAVLAGPLAATPMPTPLPAAAPPLKPPPSLEELTAQFPELADLLSDPSLGSVYKDFILAYESGGPEAARELAELRGLLNQRDEIRITLVLDSEESVAPITAELRRVGITVEGSYRERVNIGVPLALIEQLAAQQGTQALFEQLTQMEHIVRLELPLPKQSNQWPRLGQRPQAAIEGEGVAVTGANVWHTAGITGRGIRVGVLDLGFDGYRDLLGSELPDQVTIRSFVYGVEPDQSGEVHGTACTEIVHEMAPDAELFLAYYDGTIVTEGQAVEWLLEQGVHIISHSAGSILGPMDGTGDDAELVDETVAKGVLWVNSAGNEGQNHYRGVYTDSDGDGIHEFPDGSEEMTLWPYSSGMTVVLNWDDWQNLTEDYDLFLYDSGGNLVASSEDTQDGSPGQMAAEGFIITSIEDSIYYVVIRAYATTRPATFDLYALGTDIEFPVSEHSLGTPADARGALTVGATEYRDDSLATYSSQGPSNDGRLKPEISAPAGVSGATYGPDGFDGTSASTPYVSGAAALVWSAFPNYTREQVADYLKLNALDLGPRGPDNGYGYGRLQLPQAPANLGESPMPTALPLPTLEPIPTVASGAPGETPVFEYTPVATLPPEGPPGQVRGSAMPLAVVLGGMGLLGLCGAAIALVGAVLLLGAWRRSRQETVPPLPELPVPPSVEVKVPQAGQEAAVQGALPGQYGSLSGRAVGTVALKPGVTTLGRDASADVVLQSARVSRKHARLECAGNTCTLTDLNSANGTFVNGIRITRVVLSPGDRLRLGDVELTYQGPGVADSAAPVTSAGAGAGRAWLEIEGRHYPLTGAGLSIGRSHENDVCISDPVVSRQHARIEWQGGRFVLIDLNSANGTLVNGRLVRQQALRDHDEIRIGRAVLRFTTVRGSD